MEVLLPFQLSWSLLLRVLAIATFSLMGLLAERQSREQLEIAHQQLEKTNQQLYQYALRIEDQATLQERNRIAREIHDGLGHTLAAQTIQINNTLLFWQSNNDKALTFLKQAKELGAEALLEIRRSLSVLRSNPLQGQSLKSAIEKLLTDFQQTTGIEGSQHYSSIHRLLENASCHRLFLPTHFTRQSNANRNQFHRPASIVIGSRRSQFKFGIVNDENQYFL